MSLSNPAAMTFPTCGYLLIFQSE